MILIGRLLQQNRIAISIFRANAGFRSNGYFIFFESLKMCC